MFVCPRTHENSDIRFHLRQPAIYFFRASQLSFILSSPTLLSYFRFSLRASCFIFISLSLSLPRIVGSEPNVTVLKLENIHSLISIVTIISGILASAFLVSFFFFAPLFVIPKRCVGGTGSGKNALLSSYSPFWLIDVVVCESAIFRVRYKILYFLLLWKFQFKKNCFKAETAASLGMDFCFKSRQISQICQNGILWKHLVKAKFNKVVKALIMLTVWKWF